MIDGAGDDEDETEDRCGAESEDRAGGSAGRLDGGGPGEALRGPSEPSLCLEEAASRQCSPSLRPERRGGCRGAGEARGDRPLRQDRAADGGAGFFVEEVRTMSRPDRTAMLDQDHPILSMPRQCTLLSLARSCVYRASAPANENAANLALMRRLDELFMAWPFLGSRRMTAMLRGEGHAINRKRVQRLMRTMGIAALGPKPRTTKPAPGHKIHPYLLRGLSIDQPNQVCAADITYSPIGRGFLYLVAIIDWASRAVLSWRLSNTMEVSFCVAALEEALARFGQPAIFNTDQGSPFTSAAFTGVLAAAGIRISMDGRGRWRDNVFIERLWRAPGGHE